MINFKEGQETENEAYLEAAMGIYKLHIIMNDP
jgi:hypothetical protein